MLRKIVVSLVLAGGALVSAGLFAKWLVAHRPEPVRQSPTVRAPLVESVVLVPTDARYALTGFGTARCEQQATLTAEVAAQVIERVDHLNEGTAVAAGQLLVLLDDRQYQQDLAEADALHAAALAELAQVQVERGNLNNLLEIATSDLTLNRDELARVEGLYQEGHAPKSEYDSARLKYQASLRAKQDLDNQVALLEPQRQRLLSQKLAAEARTARAQLNIERCRITAPFAGVVSQLMVEMGDRVQVGGTILKLVNLGRIEVPLELPVSDRLRTQVGAPTSLHVESMPAVIWEGEVARIGPVADERSRTFTAYVEVDNRKQDEPLLPGYFVRAMVAGPSIPNALMVPRNAVIGGRLFVANDNHAHLRQVTVEHVLGDDVVLSGEVRPGDAVIVSNLDLLFDGAVVRLAKSASVTTNGAAASTASATASDVHTTGAEGGS
jgi:RND family efflux transporter MFP subunit